MFPNTVSLNQAPGIPGDPCSVNPRHNALSVPGGFVAGPNGVASGLFVWADTATNTLLSNTGTGQPTGFLMRSQGALVTTYLAEASNLIPPGKEAGAVFSGGDFFVKNAGSSTVTVGMKAYANLTNGSISFAATGATVSGSIETKWYCVALCAGGTGIAGETVKMSAII